MKIKLIIITALTAGAGIVFTAPSPSPSGGDVCVTIAQSDWPRISEAFGSILGLKDASGNPRNATAAELSDAMARWVGSQTNDYERRKNQASFTPPPFSSGSGKLNATGTTATPKKK